MTREQIRPFWRAFGRAAAALGLAGKEETEQYRHKVMMEEAGCEHLRDISPTEGYDRVMYRLALDAGDWAACARFAVGAERRMSALIESCARQVIELKSIENEAEADTPREAAIAYIVGVLRQAGFMIDTAGDEWWLDVPSGIAFTVFRILDTHRRRILRRLEWQGSLAFDIKASWALCNMQLAVGVQQHETTPIHVGRPECA